jgi:hypothetical protein
VVQRRGDFNARMQQAREIVEHQGTFVSRKGHLHRRERSIIQDMIDMSLGKKKVQSSEKMLRRRSLSSTAALVCSKATGN